jgi:DNA polymerase-3 subunit gamma/tau
VASLYRRHRPRTFADVVGQEHVVRTLSNAVSQGRVHHAYLFVGSRGTGKTSMAKILAASLNCQGEAGGGSGAGGPTISPCGKCESCVSIASATSLDVVEMDAASNNSVDDIRDLRERVGYAPVGGRHKVYILDEAHMLTTAAWNAFLKTLEEPPPHTIFVLATTEANKVLPTVVDRCHRFDFARPGVPQIASVLRRVADSESISIPDEAVALVARSATGSFRDALGTLEQLVAYSGSTVSLDDVLAVLGAADADLLFGAVDAVSSGDAAGALRAAARLADSGRDLGRFFGDLEAHARGLMITQVLGEVPAELSVTPEQDARLAEQASRVGAVEVVRLLELIAVALRAMKDGADARTQLELALVKAATPDLEPSVKALLARLERLESRPVPPSPARHDLAPATAAGRAAAATPAESAGAAAPAAPPVRELAPVGHGRTAVAITAQVEGQPPVAAVTTLPGASPTSAADAQRIADEAAASVAAELATEADPAPAVAAVAVVDPAAESTAPSFSAGIELSLEEFGGIWPAVVDSVRNDAPMLASLLEEARPSSLADQGLTLTWPESSAFSKRKAEDPANRDLIATAIRAVTGSSLRLAYELRADHEVAAAPAAPVAPTLSEEELVQRFMDEFEAEELPPEPEEQS